MTEDLSYPGYENADNDWQSKPEREHYYNEIKAAANIFFNLRELSLLNETDVKEYPEIEDLRSRLNGVVRMARQMFGKESELSLDYRGLDLMGKYSPLHAAKELTPKAFEDCAPLVIVQVISLKRDDPEYIQELVETMRSYALAKGAEDSLKVAKATYRNKADLFSDKPLNIADVIYRCSNVHESMQFTQAKYENFWKRISLSEKVSPEDKESAVTEANNVPDIEVLNKKILEATKMNEADLTPPSETPWHWGKQN